MCLICCDILEEGELDSGCNIVKLFHDQDLSSVVSCLSELVHGKKLNKGSSSKHNNTDLSQISTTIEKSAQIVLHWQDRS